MRFIELEEEGSNESKVHSATSTGAYSEINLLRLLHRFFMFKFQILPFIGPYKLQAHTSTTKTFYCKKDLIMNGLHSIFLSSDHSLLRRSLSHSYRSHKT